jgi:hypothetical protein
MYQLSKPVPASLGPIPIVTIPVPKGKPTCTHTHGARVPVQTDTGKDGVKNTHRLPMSNTNRSYVVLRTRPLSTRHMFVEIMS